MTNFLKVFLFLGQYILKEIMSDSAEVELCFSFWEKFDSLGLITWVVIPNKITIEFYFDHENIDVDIMPYVLNKMVEISPRLLEIGWKPNFKIAYLRPECELNFTKRVNFILEK